MSFAEFEKQLDDLDKSAPDNSSKSNPNDAVNDNEDGNSSDEANELYCVACNKSFKSDKA
jgi:hypothetical protein